MTDTTALRDLLAKVEAEDHRVGMWDAMTTSGHPHVPEYARQSFLGSLDAAKTLHDTVLRVEMSNGSTGWSVDLSIDYNADHVEGPEYRCTISDGNYHCTCSVYVEAVSRVSLSRAWLIAIIKSRIAGEEG